MAHFNLGCYDWAPFFDREILKIILKLQLQWLALIASFLEVLLQKFDEAIK